MSDLSYSETARRAIVLASTIAERRASAYIGTEDILLGILSAGTDNAASRWLYSKGITITEFENYLRENGYIS